MSVFLKQSSESEFTPFTATGERRGRRGRDRQRERERERTRGENKRARESERGSQVA